MDKPLIEVVEERQKRAEELRKEYRAAEEQAESIVVDAIVELLVTIYGPPDENNYDKYIDVAQDILHSNRFVNPNLLP